MSRWFPLIGFVVVLVSSYLSWVGTARACTCRLAEVSEELERSAAVFEGTVVAGYVRRGMTDSVLAVHGVHKAPWRLPTLVGVRHYTSSSCAVHLPVGARYLVYAIEREGQLEVSACSLTRPVADAQKDFALLPPPERRTSASVESSQLHTGATAIVGSKPSFDNSRAHALAVEFSAPEDRAVSVPPAVALVVDLPQSVEQRQRAREAMRALVEHLPDSAVVSVQSTSALGTSQWVKPEPLSKLDPQGRRHVADLIEQVDVGARDRLPDAIDVAARSVASSRFESSARFVVVVAAGGTYARADRRDELARSGERARDQYVGVSAIAVDPKANARGLAVLAERGRGRFHSATDPAAGATLEAQAIGSSRISFAQVEFVPATNVGVIGGLAILPTHRRTVVRVPVGTLMPGQRSATTLYLDVPPDLEADAELGTVVIRYWDPARAAGQTTDLLSITRGTR